MGWLVAIIVGAIAGWVAEKIMKARHGLITNIVLGIVGAMFFNWLIGLIGIAERTGFGGTLVAGILGACLLIWAWRKIKGR